jgi:WD40 repeat protein
MREYAGLTSAPSQVAFVPGNPPRLAAASSAEICLWDTGLAARHVSPWPAADRQDPILVVSTDGRWLAAVGRETLRYWDLSADPLGKHAEINFPGVLGARFVGPAARLTAVCIGDPPDQLTIEERSIPPSARSGPPRRTAVRVTPEVAGSIASMTLDAWLQSTTLSDDGRRLALSAREKAVHLWELPKGSPRTIRLRGFPCGLALSPNGDRLAIDAGTTVYIYDAATLRLLNQWKAKYSYVPDLAWSPDGQLLARTDRSTTVRVYEVESGNEVMAVGTKRGLLTCVAFSPDGLTLATGAREGAVRLWDLG